MIGTNPKSTTIGRAGFDSRAGRNGWRRILMALVFLPLSFVLAQCGRAPTGGTLAAKPQSSTGDSFEDRFSAANESSTERASSDAPRKRNAAAEPSPYRVASLAPTIPYQPLPREEQTALVRLK